MSVATVDSRLVDAFLLEVGEGRMPRPESEEAKAYQEWRRQEIANEWAARELGRIIAACHVTDETTFIEWSDKVWPAEKPEEFFFQD